YLIAWLDAYRSFPTQVRQSSWLWHSDNVPRESIKVMLHLTPADAGRGATRFLDLPTSTRFRACGYFGIHTNERVPDLAPFADCHGIPFRPLHFAAQPGDVLVFNNNLLHTAMPPVSQYRDVMTFLLLPSPRPWQEMLEVMGVDRVHGSPGGFPHDPW